MTTHHFLSYSSADAFDFALKLCDALAAHEPRFKLWLDKRQLRPGEDWDEQLAEAIKTCESLIFVMTRDSVQPNSVCKQEWTRALKYKKPIIPLRLHGDAELPFRLEPRQWLDFTGDFENALAKLRLHLQWLDSPAGVLQALEDRLADAQRDLQREQDPQQRTRIQTDLALLQKQIAEQQRVADDPQAARERVAASIAAGLEREREPQKPISGAARAKFINPPPFTAPSYFQDRYVETKLIADFLQDDSQRLLMLVGRGGTGKTALACRLLKALEAGHLPDELGPLAVDGIVYLSALGSRRLNLPDLYADLLKLLPRETAKDLESIYKNPQAGAEAKMRALLAAFPHGRVIVLLDNFEDVVEAEAQHLRDAELEEALVTLLQAPAHAVKVLITTRVAPRQLSLVQPARQTRLDLDKGLDSPFAENILREMDKDGKVGLKTAPEALLAEARERTRGFPRALEALCAILSADRDTTLAEILENASRGLPENVVRDLVGEAFDRLDLTAQKVMQALAIYRRPVTATAVDYLLQPFVTGVNSAPVLSRLVSMHFVRKEAGGYYLHPVDREYALSRVPHGEAGDREVLDDKTPFTQIALADRGANYFSETRLPRANWKTLADLAPQLAEIDLRCAAEDYDTAARVLQTIDYDYLLLWGHYRLMIELHENLQGKLDDPNLKRKSVGNLGTAYQSIGQVQRSIACYEQALKNAQEMKNRQAEGAWLGNLGLCYSALGQTTRAIEYHEQALAIAREIGNRTSEGIQLGNLGLCYSALGQTRRAIEFHEQALAISREIGDRRGEGTALGNLGNRYSALGQTQRAIEFHEQALAISREIGDRRGEGRHLGNLGLCYSALGQTTRAIEYHEQALAIAREIGNRTSEGIQLGNLGLCYSALGQTQRAIEFHEQALAIAREIGNRTSEGNQLGNLGNCYSALGQTQRAIEFHEQALAISREIGDRAGEGAELGSLGNCYSALGQTRRTIEYHEQALAIRREIGYRRGEGADLGNLGLCYSDLGQTQRAIEFHEQALAISREIGDRRGEGNQLGNLGLCYSALGQTKRAIELHEQALAIHREIGDRAGEGAGLGSLGSCYSDLGQTQRAIEFHEQALAISREIGDRRGEGNHLGNLGNRYSDLGQTRRAIEFHEQALAISREIGDRRGEGTRLGNLAEVLIDEGRYAEAVTLAQGSIQIGEEISSPNLGNFDNGRLALAHLQLGDLSAARTAADVARKYDEPQNNHNVLALLGVIALRQADRAAAQDAFTAAVQHAGQMLAHSAQNYEALDAKGLALSGLALCEGAQHFSAAIAAFRAARAINQDAGIVKRVLRLFDELAKVDAQGLLKEVRPAAAGA